MANASDYLEEQLLNHILENITFTSPTGVFLALSTADPLDSGAGIAEPVGNGYARVNVVGGFTVSSPGGTASNTAAIEFPEASGSWGTITHWAIFDASSGGNMLFHGALTASVAIGGGVVARFIAGAFVITCA